jgi:hypothetical protein
MSRNNKDRLGASDRNAGGEPPVMQQMSAPTNTAPQAASPLNFVSPTEFVELPSYGKFYPHGHPLYNQTNVEIKHMTTKEEDILTSQSLLRTGKAIDKLLQQILVDKRIDPDDLLIGDKNAILIAARRSGYGSSYETEIACPACQDKSAYEFSLDNVPFTESVMGDNVERTDNGTFIIKELPVTGWNVEVRPLTGKDEKALSASVESKRKAGVAEDMLTTQISLFVVSISGVTDRLLILDAISRLPAKDSRILRSAYKNLMPNTDLTQTFACPNCDYSGDMEVPFTTDFFWPKQ